jgi:hypothetical protein
MNLVFVKNRILEQSVLFVSIMKWFVLATVSGGSSEPQRPVSSNS